MQDDKHSPHTTEGDELDQVFAQAEALVRNRCEIQDLYFWLGEEAERVGFTPWRTAWLAYPMIGASDGRTYRINDHGLWEHANAD